MFSAIAIPSHTLLVGGAVSLCLLLGLLIAVGVLLRRTRAALAAFDTLFESSGQALLLLDRTGRIVRANGPALALFHTGPDGFGAVAFSSLLEDPNLAADDPWDLARSPDKPLQYVFRRPDDQTRVNAAVDFRILRYGSGNMLLAAIQDQSGVRRLHSCQARLYAMYENGCQGFAVLQSGIFVYTNTMFEQLCGLGGTQLGEQSARNVFHPQDREFVWQTLVQSARCDESSRCFLCRLQRPDGSNPLVRVTALCMPWEERPALFCFFTDISAQEQLETLREGLKTLEAANCKKPLERIIELPRRIVQEGGLTQNQEQRLRFLEQAGYELLRIIHHSLDGYRIDAGAYALVPGPVELFALLEKVAEELSSHKPDALSGVRLRLNAPGPGEREQLFIAGEALLTYQLFYECLHEITAYALPGSTVNCGVARESGTAQVECTFKSLEGTDVRVPSAGRLALMQGGAVRTQAHGEDSVSLVISLPLFQNVDDEENGISPQLPLVGPWCGIRLLLASADPVLREACKFQLKHLSFVVELAADGAHAAAQCRTRSYDLVCMDMRMRDGLHAVQQIRRMELNNGRERVPVVALLGANGDPSDRSYLEVGCQTVLSHPLEIRRLLLLVKRFTKRTYPETSLLDH